MPEPVRQSGAERCRCGPGAHRNGHPRTSVETGLRIMAVVYEPCTHPVEGVRVLGFVVEVCDRWVVVGAHPDRPIPLPPSGQVGRPLAAYVYALGIRPVLAADIVEGSCLSS